MNYIIAVSAVVSLIYLIWFIASISSIKNTLKDLARKSADIEQELKQSNAWLKYICKWIKLNTIETSDEE